MNPGKTTQKRRRNRFWQTAFILILNILILFGAQTTFDNRAPGVVAALSSYGSRGDEVRQIQKKLKSLGLYSGSVDGIYGKGTQSAVKAFQKQTGLTVDGIAGKKTLLYLGITSGSSSGGSSSSGSGSGKYSSSDVSLLARVISAEARGEEYAGQVAVGACVLNRVNHPSFPDTIAGVIYQPGAFSALNDGNWEKPVYDSAKKAAQDAINGWDPSGGAIYYYNPDKTSNQWIRSRPVIKRIGKHLFCK